MKQDVNIIAPALTGQPVDGHLVSDFCTQKILSEGTQS